MSSEHPPTSRAPPLPHPTPPPLLLPTQPAFTPSPPPPRSNPRQLEHSFTGGFASKAAVGAAAAVHFATSQGTSSFPNVSFEEMADFSRQITSLTKARRAARGGCGRPLGTPTSQTKHVRLWKCLLLRLAGW